ncbi:MAG: hypothetical protein AB7G28_25695 [Pirellulales bacterium]
MLLRTPSDCFDLSRDDLGAGKLGADAAVNTAAIQLAQDRHGFKLDSSTRVKKPIYIPPGIWTIHELILGVDDAHTAARAGLQILTGGGTGVGSNYNALYQQMGNITRLMYVGTKGDGEAAITYNGAGLWLGPMELCGITLATAGPGGDYEDRDNKQKTPTGIRITSLNTGGVPNGRIQSAGLMLQGFSKGIEVYQSDTGGNNDNLYWHFLDFDTCTVGYECNSAQSVTHQIDKVHTGFYVGTLFKFVKWGDLHCYSAQINCPNCTILDLSGMTYHENYGNFEVRNVRLDNVADNPVLLKLSAYAGKPRNVVITGTIGGDFTYTAADLVQGENAADRIFIRFTGPSQAVTDFNGQSTVDEAPF